MWTEQWPSRDLTNLKESLNKLRKVVSDPDRSLSDEVTGYLTRLLIVRSCGYLEQVVDKCCLAYLSSRAAPAAADFGSSWLGRGNNPTPEALNKLLGRFNLSLDRKLNELLARNGGYLRSELGFLVNQRNKIAHGLSENVTQQTALKLVDVVFEIADWFVCTLDPRSESN
jgi:hypothetical protein